VIELISYTVSTSVVCRLPTTAVSSYTRLVWLLMLYAYARPSSYQMPIMSFLWYRKTSDRSPRLLLVQFTWTPGLYPGPGLYTGPGYYPRFYGIRITWVLATQHSKYSSDNSSSHTMYVAQECSGQRQGQNVYLSKNMTIFSSILNEINRLHHFDRFLNDPILHHSDLIFREILDPSMTIRRIFSRYLLPRQRGRFAR